MHINLRSHKIMHREEEKMGKIGRLRAPDKTLRFLERVALSWAPKPRAATGWSEHGWAARRQDPPWIYHDRFCQVLLDPPNGSSGSLDGPRNFP